MLHRSMVASATRALMLLLGLAVPAAGIAADTPARAEAAQKTEKKVLLQISDGTEEKQTLVLNVANNLQAEYGIDNVKLEIIAFGPGLRLLFKDNVNKGRVADLAQKGVRFSACGNTLAGMARTLGKPPALQAEAVMVKAGIGRIIELTEQGYTLVRP